MKKGLRHVSAFCSRKSVIVTLQSLPDEEGIETWHIVLLLPYEIVKLQSLPDEEGIETPQAGHCGIYTIPPVAVTP